MGYYYEGKKHPRQVTTCEFCDEPTHKENKDGDHKELKPRGRMSFYLAGLKLRDYAAAAKDTDAAAWARSHAREYDQLDEKHKADYWLIMMVCKDCYESDKLKAFAFVDPKRKK